MQGTRMVGMIVGFLVLLAGGTFALQGAGMAGGGSFMDNNPSWIYIGSFLFVVGIIAVVISSGMFTRQAKRVQN
jgi:hypothetical protein